MHFAVQISGELSALCASSHPECVCANMLQADVGQLNLVLEALRERTAVLRNAPHITNPLPTIMPCYRAWEVCLAGSRLRFARCPPPHALTHTAAAELGSTPYPCPSASAA